MSPKTFLLITQKNILFNFTMERKFIAIGGGEIKNKTTLKIDEYIANLSKIHAGDKRANALFIGTASHDSMPYFNSFRKTYTSVFDIKAEVGLIVYGEMDIERIKLKIDNADMIYIGGGDTLFMLNKWEETGLKELILSAYKNGKIICGLSAGAICFFKTMFTDYEIMRGVSSNYVIKDGLNIIDGVCCPHFNQRKEDFSLSFINNNLESAYCVENDCALEFTNEKLTKVLSSGGKAFIMKNQEGNPILEELL